ncbi:MAG: DUF4279 domain-containing protein [Chloroflexi bacterium]|nr:DUF4279 domain-containing protein [Chloroflexota bacterium]
MNSLSSRFTPIDDFDADCAWTDATLTLYLGDMDPVTVTERLGLVPTSIHGLRDQEAAITDGESRNGVGCWLLSSKDSVVSRDLRRHLDWLLNRIEPAGAQLRELQQCLGMKMAVICQWWSTDDGGGIALWPEQMGRLARLNLECNIRAGFTPQDHVVTDPHDDEEDQ